MLSVLQVFFVNSLKKCFYFLCLTANIWSLPLFQIKCHVWENQFPAQSSCGSDEEFSGAYLYSRGVSWDSYNPRNTFQTNLSLTSTAISTATEPPCSLWTASYTDFEYTFGIYTPLSNSTIIYLSFFPHISKVAQEITPIMSVYRWWPPCGFSPGLLSLVLLF